MSRKATLITAIAAIATTIEGLNEKIAKQVEKRLGLEAELANFDAIDGIAAGSVVYIAVGRADTRREVEAVVRALKDKEGAEGVKVLKVEYTSAFTPGFEGRIAFTPGAFSNEFSVVDSTSVLGVKPVEAAPVDEDAELEAQIAAAEASAE